MSDDFVRSTRNFLDANPPPTLWVPTPASRKLSESEQKRYRVQQAIMTLKSAAEIRADLQLMSEVRAYVRKEREDLAVFLDAIG